jgi:hypothetical protein
MRSLHVLLPVVAVLLVAATTSTNAESTLEGNGSMAALSWTINTSLGLTDRMRTYGNGYHLTHQEEVALDKVET